MAAVATFPNPYLVAILLVCTTRTGSGAQILFHFPPHPSSEHDDISKSESAFEQSDDDSSTESDDSTTDEDDDHQFALNSNPNWTTHLNNTGKTKPANDETNRVSGTSSRQQNSTRDNQTETLFGLAEDGLVSLLSPDRTWHKRKFELSINDLTFVGRPVFVRPDGTWRREKKSKQDVANIEPNTSDTATDNEGMVGIGDDEVSRASDLEQTTSGSKSSLTMFHVVFVMNPPPLEHTLRVKEMYDHVIKKFSRALKWEQCHNDYVCKETETLSAMRASSLAKRVGSPNETKLAHSTLAVAISTVFTAISSSRIASVTLSPKVKFSLQIPPVTSTSYLPSLTDPPIQPGLWLTTATDIGSSGGESEGAESGHSSNLAKHYTLLLKSPPHRIAKDAIEAGGRVAATLPKFVSLLRPTNSFYKLHLSSHMPIREIQVLAHHLIYWRRAVLIPPLHSKDIYIVSPNANMRKLRDHTRSFEQQFAPTMPNMPSLPKILSILSGTPRTFGSVIPSTDHKEIYYLALAWLLRNGWVTQLRTFVYIRVDPDVKRIVRERDREAKFQGLMRQKTQKDEGNPGRELGKPNKRPSIVSRPSSDGRRSMEGGWPLHNPRMASLILNPPRASPTESKWLDYIEEQLADGDDLVDPLSEDKKVEVQKYWPQFIPYFNGQVALETVPVRENIKRKFFWSLLKQVGFNTERGIENENKGNRTILVPVRHW